MTAPKRTCPTVSKKENHNARERNGTRSVRPKQFYCKCNQSATVALKSKKNQTHHPKTCPHSLNANIPCLFTAHNSQSLSVQPPSTRPSQHSHQPKFSGLPIPRNLAPASSSSQQKTSPHHHQNQEEWRPSSTKSKSTSTAASPSVSTQTLKNSPKACWRQTSSPT